MNRARPAAGGGDVDLDRGSQGRAIGLGPDELDLQPVTAVASVSEQEGRQPIARDGSSGVYEEIQVAIHVPVGERYTCSFLDMTCPAGFRDILKMAPANILEQNSRKGLAENGHPAAK